VSHIYVIALTLVTILVVVLLTAVPTIPHYDLEEQWNTFERLEAVPRGMAPLQVATPAGAPSTEWRKTATLHSSLGRHDHYVQYIHGRPVEGSWAAVHQLADGRRRTAGRLTPLDAGTVPDPDTTRARNLALDEIGVGALRAAVRTTAGWIPDVRGLRPVVTVVIPGLHPLGDWQVRVDDTTGEVLSVQNLMCHLEATGWVFATVPDMACGSWDEVGDEELMGSVSTASLTRLDESGRLTNAYVEVTSGDGPLAISPEGRFHYPPSDPRFEQVMCYHTITRYLDHVDALGVDGYGARTIRVDARGYPGDNSFFSPATGEIRFGIGGVPDAQDPEIILHELGHALHHQAHPRYPEHESSRAISEGLADYLACSFFGDARLAEWDADAYSSACPPFLRRIDERRTYPDDLTGQIHEDGLIWASALWSVRAVLGEARTDHILLESLFLLPPQAGLPHAAAAFVDAARMLYDDEVAMLADGMLEELGLRGANAPTGPRPDLFARAAPNPFAAETTIRYVIPQAGFTRVDILDVRGRVVRSVVAAHQPVGSHRATWDGRDGNGVRAAGGIYFYQVTAGTHRASGRLVHIPG
jgi:hypothetical protein